MPGITDKKFNAIQRRLAAAQAAPAERAVREYIDPINSEALVTAAQKRANRTRAQRPSTPPVFDSPMPDFCLEPANPGQTQASMSNLFYTRAEPQRVPSSPLFFPLSAQAHPPFIPLEGEVNQAEVDASAQQPHAQGSRVSVVRKLRALPTTMALDILGELSDTLSEGDDLAEIINAWSTTTEAAEHTDTTVGESEHFAGAAAIALRRRNLRPAALNPAMLATFVLTTDTVPEPQAPRQPLSFLFKSEGQEHQASAFDFSAQPNDEAPTFR